MLLISVVFTVPFSWLHQCEYQHAHFPEKNLSGIGNTAFSQERVSCALCELEFPMYLATDTFSASLISLSYPVFAPEFRETVIIPVPFSYTLRGPPLG
ncbi:MAG: hypothetical protein R3C61_09545 [Bacteroidia bacterium]